MKHRPIYFAAAFLLLLLICTAYNLSYHYITGNPPSAEESADHESETIRSAPANAGNPHPVYQYYLTEEQGCVSIYLDDKETLYENTSIRLSSLPDALKTEIKNGKYIRTEKELYDLLESYSSKKASREQQSSRPGFTNDCYYSIFSRIRRSASRSPFGSLRISRSRIPPSFTRQIP